ncbi:Mobilization protein (fragment) [Candidatus Desulfosporosinus infrequens]|uniref:Mobilization protein n=1 Tax=Candidatus Desulfosporosinus infrequens TaxID=2043169 RepID=A0A2U3LR03_9FIRM
MPRKRAMQLKFFVSDEELERIKSKVAASKLNQSDFLRKSALEKEIVVIDGIKELVLELKRIGVNLNQLTKLVHQDRLSDHDGRLQEIHGELKEAWHSLRQLIRVRGR